MAGSEPIEQDLRAWFTELQACVRAADYERAERIFAPDVIGFGTYKDIAEGRASLRAKQWSKTWPTVKDFTSRLDAFLWGADGQLAWAACPWDSVGSDADGRTFTRPGRVSTVFERRDGHRLQVPTHFSLCPTPVAV